MRILLLFLIVLLSCFLTYLIFFYKDNKEQFDSSSPAASGSGENSCEEKYRICLEDRVRQYLAQVKLADQATHQGKPKEKYSATDNNEEEDPVAAAVRSPGSTSSDVRSPTSTEVRSPTSTSTEVRSPTSTSTEVRSPTSTSTEVRSPTSTSTEVRSPTSTSTEVRSPTSTSTDAYTQGNVTVTGGAGAGATSVHIYGMLPPQPIRADDDSDYIRSQGSATRMQEMIKGTGAPRVKAVNPALMEATGAPRVQNPTPDIMKAVDAGDRPQNPIHGMMEGVDGGSRPTSPINNMMEGVDGGSRPKNPIKDMMEGVNGCEGAMCKRSGAEDNRYKHSISDVSNIMGSPRGGQYKNSISDDSNAMGSTEDPYDLREHYGPMMGRYNPTYTSTYSPPHVDSDLSIEQFCRRFRH